MSKLTLASLAVLCTLFISCEKQEMTSDATESQRIESRSVADNILLNYITAAGSSVTYQCTKATVSYKNNFIAEIHLDFADNSTHTSMGSNISLSPEDLYVLEVTKDNSSVVEVPELAIAICGTELCYSSGEGGLAGTAVDFIVEDVPQGF